MTNTHQAVYSRPATSHRSSVSKQNYHPNAVHPLSRTRKAPSTAGYGATCGVSSIGPLATFFKRGTYDLKNLGDKDFAADFRDVNIGVRARENEFLVGSSTSAEGIIGFGVSYDLNAISAEAAEVWKETMEGMLEVREVAKL